LLTGSLQHLPTQLADSLAAALRQQSFGTTSAAEREQHDRVVAAVAEALQPVQQQVQAFTQVRGGVMCGYATGRAFTHPHNANSSSLIQALGHLTFHGIACTPQLHTLMYTRLLLHLQSLPAMQGLSQPLPTSCGCCIHLHPTPYPVIITE
jgi:hypothetical protein